MLSRYSYRKITRLLKHQQIKEFSSKNLEKILATKTENVEIPKVPLHEYLWNNLERNSNKTAVVCLQTSKKYSYYELYKKSLSLANFLRNNLKLHNSNTVGVILHNVPEYLVILLGAIHAGLRVTTFNPNYTPDEIGRQITNSETQVMFASSQTSNAVKQALNQINKKIPIIEVNDLTSSGLSDNIISFDEISSCDLSFQNVNINVDEPVLMPYSSGTTGVPKGVQLTHFNLVANLTQATSKHFNLLNQSEEQDVISAFLPFYHIYGLTFILLQGMHQGAKMVSMPKFSSETFIQVLREHKPNIVPAIPLVVNMATNNSNITEDDLSCVRFMTSGAAPLGGADVERFRTKTKDNVRLLQAYGMTEASPLVSIQTEKLENGIKIGGSGLFVPNTLAKIVAVDDSSNNFNCLEPGEAGELLLKGPQIMPCYFNNPKATEESFTSDGWYKTGDIGYYDESGHLYITDRLKELIKVKGFQVAPAELEEILRDHPKIEDAAVVGVPHDLNGEAPRAFIVLKPGKDLKPRDVEEFVASKVSKHKHLVGGVKFLDAIPKNPSGKILRRELSKII